ncbi:shikimate kinase [Pseudochrobactrum asaccharolyticum]|jgi:shikimate kinase|uniref:Shikimate kinase n=1 Tax=Pseudochrobactrum asaccharolyticum TaxID=354351 RepID=A0A366E6E3_9HYPH|nr:shikimate kinase [Pseudochrobactrum asaccharolyticum]MBX8801443.1 shikimate kinase [Ochrobactrum sp. MR28]MBX8815233.1 shikimate kinase [Ochrobactrum sp. MR31]MDR2311233.1 shikimate kinase [Brucellaceae bacterium]RBO97887.1 shikimate kinase [Pseudochrobactrum asaccharolyticum]
MPNQNKKADQINLHSQAEEVKALLNQRPVVLVGLMGAGKSTIGKKMASMLELPFFDLDTEIENVSRMSVTELFASYGEPEFRDLERRVMQRLLEGGSMILATGGGAYMNEQTRENIASAGISVWLNAELDVLMERVLRRHDRPLLKNDDPRAVMQKLMTERYPVYATADLSIMSRDEKREVIAQEVITLLLNHLRNTEPHQD